MTETPPLRKRLDSRIRLALEPRRFPERRDVELAFRISNGASGAAFFDHFWVDSTSLWAVAARIDGRDLEAAIAATTARQLVRALAHEVTSPSEVLPALRTEWGGDVVALAVARLDTAAGSLASACWGDGACTPGTEMKPGTPAWLVVGGALPDEHRIGPEGLQALVDNHGGEGAVVAAFEFKAPAKKRSGTTLIIRNDRSAIVDALADTRALLERNAVDETDISALELALDEILTNQINYGYTDGEAHEILLDVRIEPPRIRVEVSDDGVPFDPTSVSAPDLDAGIEDRQIGGLGMHFVRSLMSEVIYRRSGGWNILSICRPMTPADPEGSRP